MKQPDDAHIGGNIGGARKTLLSRKVHKLLQTWTLGFLQETSQQKDDLRRGFGAGVGEDFRRKIRPIYRSSMAVKGGVEFPFGSKNFSETGLATPGWR